MARPSNDHLKAAAECCQTSTRVISRSLVNLAGYRILVVEDNFMVAEHIFEMLTDAGAEVLGPSPDVADTLSIVAGECRIDAALLDVMLRGKKPVWPVIDVLLARGVPVVLSSGYDLPAMPFVYTHLPRCPKPTNDRELIRVLAQAIHQSMLSNLRAGSDNREISPLSKGQATNTSSG